jgi:phage FluMu gp28-like protein
MPTADDLIERYLLPYQRFWVRGPEAVAVAEKSRRIGWTYASAFRAVHRRAWLKTDLFYTSADLTAAREFIQACQRWAGIFKVLAIDEGEQCIDEEAGITALVLRFENGGRVVAGSSNPKFFRSKGGDADADEFAFHAQPRELYKAMQPAALMWGHQLRLWSTHNGEGSYFNQLIRAGRKQEEEGAGHAGGDEATVTGQPLRVRRVTLHDAIGQGLVERIRGLRETNPPAREEFLAEIRASCPDPDAWNEEYLCVPASGQSSLLGYGLIRACEAANLRLMAVEDLGAGDPAANGSADAPLSSAVLYAGYDVGRKHDRSVLWVLEQVGDVFWTRVLRVLEGATFTAQEDLLNLLMRARAVRRLCIDSTGIGAMLAERLAGKWGSRVEAVHFTSQVKAELALPLLRLFQEKLVRVPAEADVREDLHKVRKMVTAASNVRFDAARDADGHADRFWALALACHGAERSRGRLPAPLKWKPLGW